MAVHVYIHDAEFTNHRKEDERRRRGRDMPPGGTKGGTRPPFTMGDRARRDAVNYGVNVSKEGKYFVVSGTIATTARGQKGLGPEDYSRVFRTKAEADRDAAKWNRNNTEAVAMWAERETRRRSQAQEYLNQRSKRGNGATQLSFEF